MNRLLRIGLDTLFTSITPILGWFLLGILVDKNLINIFSLMYPMQFIIRGIQCVFGTGANVSAIKDKEKSSVFSGVILGSIIGGVILGIIVLNIDKYIEFMNMDVKTYKIFGVYAVIQIFFQLLLNLSLCKLYFENKNKKANKYSFLFNLINFLSLIIMSLITKHQVKIVVVSIICTGIFVIIMMFRLLERTKFRINIINCIKYDSVYLFAEISMFIIYLFGFKNSFNFGEKYILATSFATLITDTQWDIAFAIKIVAQIDIAKRVFSYKEHIKNSRKLVILLIMSSISMGILLYPIYRVDIAATVVMVGAELMSLYMYPIYLTNLTYIQLEYSAIKATINKQIANIIRTICSFIASPFCTSIGLVLSVIYQLTSTQYIIIKNKINMEMEELIDVLDEKGNNTGEVLTREQIHKKGLWHKIVVIAIIDKNKNILMQKRAKNKKENPEKWDVSAGGHVSSGQNSIDAAIRETFEEIGIKVNEKELEYIFTYKNSKKLDENYIDNEIYDCYIVKKQDIKLKDIKIQKSEVERVKLCNITEFRKIIKNKNAMNRLELYNKIIEYLK